MRICVFCGSSSGNQSLYLDAAQQLGTTLAKAGITLVYGGAQVGLMGAVADAAIAAGGEVIGVIPRHLVERELAHTGLTELREVGSMHERKAMMADLSDGFIALPGGVGTFEELFEVWTWAQLGHHQKPCALFNAGGYYDKLIAFLDHAMNEGFMKQAYREMLIVAPDVESLMAKVEAYEAPKVAKWMDKEER
ncbi:TIGR00730 family Rossman fold protein [Halopseudomonas pelagia]|uniref:Cytokinin riboside 5'-monophosphate phosphoribohydrolase n=1 Tax=Halopseudomonas pelagia TaxID=553151 RepID=A0AA91U0E3_9GAMM|nr:TIGR00730 family Rossman fold protein [Halopseudomonas pelagia]PCC98315.1 TIGR00730 family Rossman fold protein [Halopseudomonas pelagia]QFY56670.1 TIGR00730 family Rossman fold protein [Halopseudomonas pelagia]